MLTSRLMTIALSQKLQLYAKRAQFFSVNEQISGDFKHSVDLALDNTTKKHRIYFHYRQKNEQSSDIFLTTTTNVGVLESAYLEAFGELASNLNWNKLIVLGTRELEHFLRDQNHTIAHEVMNDHPPGLWLESLREAIFRPWLVHRLGLLTQSLSTKTNALELSEWLEQLRLKGLGAQNLAILNASYAIGLSPLAANGFEIRWHFPSEITPREATSLCLALEEALSSKGLRVKVVAES